MASEEIDQQFVMPIFRVAAKPVPLALVEMHFRGPAVPLQAIPQAACHLDGPENF
jgi:hypothetical protein